MTEIVPETRLATTIFPFGNRKSLPACLSSSCWWLSFCNETAEVLKLVATIAANARQNAIRKILRLNVVLLLLLDVDASPGASSADRNSCSQHCMQETGEERLTSRKNFSTLIVCGVKIPLWLRKNAMGMNSEKITNLLVAWNHGDQQARDELMPLIYDELRRIAQAYLRRERADHTLQPTALVHEAFLRLVDQSRVNWQNRAHFFGSAARLMRQILINHAEARQAAKRGGEAERISLNDVELSATEQELDLIALDEALKHLERIDLPQSRIVELRYFSGLTIEEIAEVMSLSPATVKREWNTARAWLRRELSR